MLAKVLIIFAAAPVLVLGGGFLRNQRHKADVGRFQRDVEVALHEVQGCGGRVQLEHLADVEQRIQPMWKSLPKNGEGRVERALLRHLVHRYFRQRYSFIIRGFEESRPASDSSWEVEQALSERVPGHIEAVLASSGTGFSLIDAVRVVAVIEELILDQEVLLLEEAYDVVDVSTGEAINEARLMNVMEVYLELWLEHERLPYWGEVLDFVRGEARALRFRRMTAKRGGSVALSGAFTFDDAREVVKSITTSFGSFFSPVCNKMLLEPLERIDTRMSGRVSLAQFYGASDSFSESAEHLRTAGALEESGRTRQVLIANYVLGTSNCYIATSHYMVCCSSTCEGIHGEIEQAIGGALAVPEDLLALVGNMTRLAAWDASDVPVSQTLTKQLGEIAAVHSGKVPLHGRLFAQWLHYVFPQQCPFPHKAGSVVAAGPAGRDTQLVSQAEKDAVLSNVTHNAEYDEEGWIPQWSMEEELMSDYAALEKPTRGRTIALLSAPLLLVAGLAGPSLVRDKDGLASSRLPGYSPSKAHLV